MSAVGVYDALVAPGIGMPSASHWSLTAPAGVQWPAEAISGWSTCGVPAMVGGESTRNCPGATTSVGSVLETTLRYPSAATVTLTRTRWPSWAAVGVNVDAVAPATGAPPANHW